MATNPNDPRPQAKIETVSSNNLTAARGAYVDTSLTRRNGSSTPDAILPLKSGSTTLGNIRRFYAENRAEEIDATVGDQGAVVPPHSPVAWKPGRDYYKIDGMVSQDFYKNQGV
jgi:hypothetical protein